MIIGIDASRAYVSDKTGTENYSYHVISEMLRLPDAKKHFTEFYKAISTQELSMFNIMYADKHDTIYYINSGLVPVRDSSKSFNWRRTLPGNTSKTLWTNFRSMKELPQYLNPSSGFIFNTNHSSFLATGPKDNLKPSSFPKADGWEMYHNNRSARFAELFPLTEKLSYEKFKEIKFDKQLPMMLRYPYGIDTMSLLNANDYPEYSSLINEFKNWNKSGVAESKGAAIFLLSYF